MVELNIRNDKEAREIEEKLLQHRKIIEEAHFGYDRLIILRPLIIRRSSSYEFFLCITIVDVIRGKAVDIAIEELDNLRELASTLNEIYKTITEVIDF